MADGSEEIGAMLMNAFDNHSDREQEQAYDQGYDNGQSHCLTPLAVA
jgi:hypothetical protein